MISLTNLICENMKLNPLTTFQQLRHAKSIVCYHASENQNFEPENKPLHVGSYQQAFSLARNMLSAYKDKKFYIYEMIVDIKRMPNFLFDEDPQVERSQAKYNSYAYSNRIEYTDGLHHGTNISIVLMDPVEQITSKQMVRVV